MGKVRQTPRMRRDGMRVSPFFLGALASLALIAAAVLAILALSDIAAEHAENFARNLYPIIEDRTRADAVNASATFLSYKFGVPVSAVGVLVGLATTLLAAYVGWVLASRQGDIQILEFVEQRLRVSVKANRTMVRALGDMVKCGEKSLDLAKRIVDKLIAQPSTTTGTTSAVYRAQDLKLTPVRSDITATPILSDKFFDEFMPEIKKFTEEFPKANSAFRQAFRDIDAELYSTSFFRHGFEFCAAAGRPSALRRLAKLAPTIAQAKPEWFSEKIADIAENLDIFCSMTQPSELIRAVTVLPQDFEAIDFIGAVIFSPGAPPPHPHRYRDKHICGYRLNIGAAFLVALYQVIPDQDVQQQMFKKIFGGRSEVTTNLISAIFPQKSELAPAAITSTLDRAAGNLNRLLIVDVLNGDHTSHSFHCEFYDPQAHGPIPSDAFDTLLKQMQAR